MISAPLPDNEDERIRALLELEILDTLEEQAYDDLTLLAAQICQTPIALVSLVDRRRQWFKSHHGLDARETPRELAFCAHAILGDKTFIVDDADHDQRFFDNPLVSGEPHVKFYAGVPLVLSNNMPIGTLCVIDNHARKLSDEQRLALEALSRQVITQLELRIKLKQLQVLDKTKDDFISVVSHELRTPITSINGSLSILNNMMIDTLDKDAASLAEIAYRNSERLTALVNDILDATRIDAGRFELRLEHCRIGDLIQEAVELNRPYVEKCKCALNTDLSSECAAVTVNVDKNRILQVLSNLISNAAKFSPEGERVAIELVIANSNICISVADHGCGIKPEDQPRVFSRFAQLSPDVNRKLPGTGLGLSIAKAIVEQHGGRIGFESSSGKGSRFYFYLPMV